MKNTLTTIIISLMLFGAVLLLAWPGQEPPGETATSDGALVASVSFHDFGATSMADGKVAYEYQLMNEGTEAIKVGKVYTSCMCTSAAISIGDRHFGPYGMAGHGFIPRVNESLEPGQTAQVMVTFDPAAHGPAGVGKVQRTVTIEQDGADPLVVSFVAQVTP